MPTIFVTALQFAGSWAPIKRFPLVALCLGGVLLPMPEAAAETISAQADLLVLQGNCGEAINRYRDILNKPGLPGVDKVMVSNNLAYCYILAQRPDEALLVLRNVQQAGTETDPAIALNLERAAKSNGTSSTVVQGSMVAQQSEVAPAAADPCGVAPARTGRITTNESRSDVNVRREPSTQSASIATLRRGTDVQVYPGSNGGWTHVRIVRRGGMPLCGFVANKFIIVR